MPILGTRFPVGPDSRREAELTRTFVLMQIDVSSPIRAALCGVLLAIGCAPAEIPKPAEPTPAHASPSGRDTEGERKRRAKAEAEAYSERNKKVEAEVAEEIEDRRARDDDARAARRRRRAAEDAPPTPEECARDAALRAESTARDKDSDAATKWMRANCEEGFYDVMGREPYEDENGFVRMRDVIVGHVPKWTCPMNTPREIVAAANLTPEGGKLVSPQRTLSANQSPGQVARRVRPTLEERCRRVDAAPRR